MWVADDRSAHHVDPGVDRHGRYRSVTGPTYDIAQTQPPKGDKPHAELYVDEKSDEAIVCAGQRMSQEGSSPSGARMRSAVSKGGVMPRQPAAEAVGRQGVRSDPESEGFEEKYRAAINGGYPDDEQVGQRWGKVEPALWGRRRYSFTHRTKVFADGTIRKIHA